MHSSPAPAESVGSAAPELAVVLTVHHEGRLLVPTARALAATIEHARTQGLNTEVIVVADRADAATSAAVADLLSRQVWAQAVRVQTLTVDHGDLGLARNAGIALTSAARVTVLDADNLPSRTWLASAAAALDALGEPGAVHPERILTFDGKRECWPLRASTDPGFHAGDLLWFNTWDAFAMISREVLQRFPYPLCRPSSGFGPEDHAWNATTVAAGVPHGIAAGTTLFYHAKRSGSLAQAHGASVLPRNDLLTSRTLAQAEVARLDGLLAARDASRAAAQRQQAGMELAAGLGGLIQRARRRIPGADVGYRAARYLAAPALARLRARRAAAAGESDANQAAPGVREQTSAPSAVVAVPTGDWRAAHLLQPRIPVPSPARRADYTVWGDSWDTMFLPDRRAYWAALAALPEQIDVLFVVPWIATGGADLMMLTYINAVRRTRPEASIAVITTDGTHPSTRLGELPADVVVHDLGAAKLLRRYGVRVLGMLLTQLRPGTVHVINSTVGYDTIERHGTAIAAHSTVYLSTYVVDELKDGTSWSFLYNRRRDFYAPVRRVLTDSQAFIDQIVTATGAPTDLFQVHHQIVAGTPRPPLPDHYDSQQPLRVLWAGRFDRQKRLDRLADVLAELRRRGVPIELDFYGEVVIDDDPTWRESVTRLEALGARRHPAYHGDLRAVAPENFEVLLLTSDREGVPNTMLEAMANGLAVVAPAVGGVGEVLTADCGYPVATGSDPEVVRALADALEQIAGDPAAARQRAAAGSELVRGAFSQEQFDATLEELGDYLPRARTRAGVAGAGAAGGGRGRELRLHYYADEATAALLSAGTPLVPLYTGSNGHSNFGDILQNKNIIHYWNRRPDAVPVLLLPAFAALPDRHARLREWYTPNIVYVSQEPWTQGEAQGLVPVAPPQRAELLHVVGGGYLNALWGAAHFAMIENAARDWQVGSVVLSGLQIDRPALAGFQHLLASGLAVETMGLRDHASYALAQQAGLGERVRFTFDDLTELFQDWSGVREPTLVAPTDGLRYAIHMNSSDYAGGPRAVARWREVLAQVAAQRPDQVYLLHSYADGRPEIQDVLGTADALAEDFPFADVRVLGTALAALDAVPGQGLPAALEPWRGVTATLSSSYHITLCASFLGSPAYLVNASDYFAQKAALFRLPDIATFLRDPAPSLLRIPEEIAARERWLGHLDSLPASPGSSW